MLFPVFALIISTIVEGYQWTPIAFAGVALVGIGNVVILTRPKPKVKPDQPMI